MRAWLGCFFALFISYAHAQVNPGTSPLTIPKGGTGAATASAARTSLGLGPFATQTSPCTLAQGCLGGSQAAATANQVPVYPGSGGGAVPTAITSLINTVCGLSPSSCVSLFGYANAKWFGAVGNNVADDTSALNSWLSYCSTNGATCTLPAGTYKITSCLTAIAAGGWGVTGAGRNNTTITYSGASTTCDVLHFGTGASTGNLFFTGFTVCSVTTMSAGAALHVQNANKVTIDVDRCGLNLAAVSGQLYNGLYLDTLGWAAVSGNGGFASNDDIVMSNCVEINLDQVRIANGGANALHAAGGNGGIYTGYVSIFGGAVGLRVDNSIASVANSQFFISSRTAIDTTTTQNIVLNDTITGSQTFVFNGWSASSSGQCFDIIHWPGNLSINGELYNCTGSGLLVQNVDANQIINIGQSAVIARNTRYGVECSVSCANIYTSNQPYLNTLGPYNSNFANPKFVIGDVASPGSSATNNAATNLTSISLAPGIWAVSGIVCGTPAATTLVERLVASISTTTGTPDGTNGRFMDAPIPASGFTVTTGANACAAVPPSNFTITTTTTVYLIYLFKYATSTATIWGDIQARQVQ